MIEVCILYKHHRWAENVYEDIKKRIEAQDDPYKFGQYIFRYDYRWEIIFGNVRVSFVRYDKDKIKERKWDYIMYESLTFHEYDEMKSRCKVIVEY